MKIIAQNYEVIRELGRGGMGAVYLANDRRLDREVAIKVLQLDPNLDEEASKEIVQRFHKEAKAIAKLNHPNIVSIYDIGTNEGNHYMVIELLEGQALENSLKKGGKLSQEKVVDIGIQICSALAYSHKNGIIHRDIKPANIMLSPEGVAKLTDFGIAQLGNDKLALTQAGSILGSILYIPPEQLIDSSSVDKRADIYSLGVTLFQLITGRLPFEGNAVAEVITKILNEEISSLKSYDPNIPEVVNKVIMKAISKTPEGRYQNVSEFEDELKKAEKYLQNPNAFADEKNSKKTAPLKEIDNELLKTVNISKNNTKELTGNTKPLKRKSSGSLKGTGKLKGSGSLNEVKIGTSKLKQVNKKPQTKKEENKKTGLIIGGVVSSLILLVSILAFSFGGEKESPKKEIKSEIIEEKPSNNEKLKPESDIKKNETKIKEIEKDQTKKEEPKAKKSIVPNPTPKPVVKKKIIPRPRPTRRIKRRVKPRPKPITNKKPKSNIFDGY